LIGNFSGSGRVGPVIYDNMVRIRQPAAKTRAVVQNDDRRALVLRIATLNDGFKREARQCAPLFLGGMQGVHASRRGVGDVIAELTDEHDPVMLTDAAMDSPLRHSIHSPLAL
jgi:hypothetical protein